MLTNAALHDAITPLALNLLFLLVFGLRINELIGDIKMTLLYPIFALATAAIYVLLSRNQPPHLLLGASGAVAALAGMYLVLLPLQPLQIAVWFAIVLYTPLPGGDVAAISEPTDISISFVPPRSK